MMLIDKFHPLLGGTESQVQLLANWLVDHETPVEVLTRQVLWRLPLREIIGALPVRRLPPPGRNIGSRVAASCVAYAYCVGRRHEYDILHANALNSFSAGAVAGAVDAGKPVILRVTVSGEMSRLPNESTRSSLLRRHARAWLGLDRLRLALFRRSTAFVALTNDTATELLANGVPADKIHIIPTAVDADRFSPPPPVEVARARQLIGAPRSGPLVVYSGRFVSRKGLDVLIDAWAGVLATFPNACLLLVGTGANWPDSSEASLRRTVVREGLTGAIRFVGHVQDVRPYLHASDVFVLPSWREGLSNALLEAMSTALPVIASNIPGNADLVVDGVNGFLVPPGDPAMLARHLSTVLSSPERSRTMGERGRETVLKRYDVRAAGRAYHALYSRLLTGSASAQCPPSQ